MSPKLLNLPGLGFGILVASYAATAAFLFFGGQKPRLEEAFEILSQRERATFAGYTKEDVQVLEGALRDHPGFSRALVGRTSAKFLEPRVAGWLKSGQAHLAVRPDKEKPTVLRLESQGAQADFPLTISIVGKGINKQLQLGANEAKTVEFSPSELTKASILDFQVKTPTGSPQSSPTWGLRIVPPASSTSREAP